MFPRYFWVDGSVERCAEVGDFAADAGYRTLGPVLRLQRATLGPVDDGLLKFCYDCPPDDRGMAPFQRMGLSPIFRRTRFRCFVRTDGLIRRRLALGPRLQVPVTAFLNSLLWARRLIHPRARELDLELHDGPFGEEFDALASASGEGLHGESAAYGRRSELAVSNGSPQ